MLIRLRVKTLTGITFHLILPSGKETVLDIKKQLPFEVAGQIVVYKGAELPNFLTLDQVGVKTGDFCVLVYNKQRLRDALAHGGSTGSLSGRLDSRNHLTSIQLSHSAGGSGHRKRDSHYSFLGSDVAGAGRFKRPRDRPSHQSVLFSFEDFLQRISGDVGRNGNVGGLHNLLSGPNVLRRELNVGLQNKNRRKRVRVEVGGHEVRQWERSRVFEHDRNVDRDHERDRDWDRDWDREIEERRQERENEHAARAFDFTVSDSNEEDEDQDEEDDTKMLANFGRQQNGPGNEDSWNEQREPNGNCERNGGISVMNPTYNVGWY